MMLLMAILSRFPRFLSLVAGLVLAAPLLAQPVTDERLGIVDMQAPQVQVLPTQGLVWEITHPDLAHRSYVYAILYRVPADFFFLPPGITPLIQGADRLVMEVDPANLDVDHLFRGDIPIDSTLEALLPPRDYPAFWTYLEDSLSAVAAYKLESRYAPALLERQIMSDYCLGHRRRQELISYEWYLYDVVRKPLKVLNTGWARTAWLDSYNYREQADRLRETLENRASLCETYWALLRAYRTGDLDRVWLLAKDAPDLGDNMGRFIAARNEAWLKTLSWQLAYESLFIAVNAVQLPGEAGLLHQLRKAGYTVKAVPFSP